MLKFLFDKNNIYAHKLAVIILALISFFYFKPLLLLFFPGLLFLFYVNIKTNFFENFLFSIALSISYWIGFFWLLKLIPFDLTEYIYLTILITLILVLLKSTKEFYAPKITKKDCFSFIFVFLTTLSFIPIFLQKMAPPGADMSTHTYIARLITETNGFPTSYEPVAPIQNFGSSPFGMPILIALLFKTSAFTIGQSAILVTILTYFLLGGAVYIFLNKYFSNFVSFITVFSILWVSINIHNYIVWGGNPNIFSISLVIFSLVYSLRVLGSKQFTKANSFIIAMLLFASFTTHQLPPFVMAYYVLAIFIFELKKITKKLNRENITFIAYIILFLLIFSIPFLTLLKLPSQETLDHIKELHRLNENIAWNGNLINAVYTLPLYIQNHIGWKILFIGSVGILLAQKTFKKNGHSRWFILAIFISILLIINSKFWILPFSPLFFPDRVLTLTLIPFSYFIAEFFRWIINVFIRSLKSKSIFSLTNLSTIISIIILFVSFTFEFVINYKQFDDAVNKTVSVTQNDLSAFEWISKNTTPDDVFLNNYGDAGLWIPAFTTRKIIFYDFILYERDEIYQRVRSLKPTYLYLGSKVVYADAIYNKYEKIINNPSYKLVYFSGDTKIFKILNK